MKQRTKTAVILIFIFLATLILCCTASFAEDDSSIELDNKINVIAGGALRYLQLLGSIIAVTILAVYGVKWVTANGQERADLKGKMGVYILGAVLVYGGCTIAVWAIEILNDNLGEYICPVAESPETAVMLLKQLL